MASKLFMLKGFNKSPFIVFKRDYMYIYKQARPNEPKQMTLRYKIVLKDILSYKTDVINRNINYQTQLLCPWTSYLQTGVLIEPAGINPPRSR